MYVLDNVFNEETEIEIKENIFSNLDFYYKQNAVSGKPSILTCNTDFFCHMFCDGELKSNAYSDIVNIFEPIFHIVGKKYNKHSLSLGRAKANFFKPHHNLFEFRPLPFHIDSPDKHLVVLYYVNNSDGPTVIGKKIISPKQGRLVIFDGSIYHTHFLPRFSNRVTLNFNLYYE